MRCFETACRLTSYGAAVVHRRVGHRESRDHVASGSGSAGAAKTPGELIGHASTFFN
ncbi:hypothetical protein [Nocardioides sp. B-3]|uniref:hypothetical protein n=1 Tax=Nocardioides sp. B-3 TaxID=2895565 RepID=UPI002342C46E|nr:hypothetical protein [Nocardioides sp. B-3]